MMKKVIEERRNEAYASRSDGADENEDQQVHLMRLLIQSICSSRNFFIVVSFQEKRLSDLSNQSHDSQVSNSTLSATSHEDRLNAAANSQREVLVDGHSAQDEEELDEMEVEYIEVIIILARFNNSTHVSLVNTLVLIFCHH